MSTAKRDSSDYRTFEDALKRVISPEAKKFVDAKKKEKKRPIKSASSDRVSREKAKD